MSFTWKPYVEFNWRYMSRPVIHFDMEDDTSAYLDLSWGEPYADPIWLVGVQLEGLPEWIGRVHSIWWRWRHPSCPDPDCALLKDHNGLHVEIVNKKVARSWT